MKVTRRGILRSDDAQQRFLTAVVALNREGSGLTTADVNRLLAPQVPGFRIRGIDQELSTWSLFVLWHFVAMMLRSQPERPLRNLAHGGPVFLPWHRLFLLRLEQHLQRVTDPDTALPYWDWSTDGQLPASDQPRTRLWSDAVLGPSQGLVTRGQLADFRVQLVGHRLEIWSIAPRPLERAAGTDIASLPTPAHVRWALDASEYDSSTWDSSVDSFRNRVEGWADPEPPRGEPQLHNRVHVWVGGDMGPGTSPNDPVFYLNHCNVDRLWATWIKRHGEKYRPTSADPDAPGGHRRDDPLVALIGQGMRTADLLDTTEMYVYDQLVT